MTGAIGVWLAAAAILLLGAPARIGAAEAGRHGRRGRARRHRRDVADASRRDRAIHRVPRPARPRRGHARARATRTARCSRTSAPASGSTTRSPAWAGRPRPRNGRTGPHLDDARTRFPDEPDEAFPSPEHPWGVQTLYLQVLADAGVIGFAALVDAVRRRRDGRRAGRPRLAGPRRRPRVAPRRRRRVGRDRARAGDPARRSHLARARAGDRPWLTRASTRVRRCRRTPSGRRSSAGWPRRRAAHTPTSAPYRLLDVGCGEMPYRPLFAAYAATYVGVDPVAEPAGRAARPDRGAPRRGRLLRRRPLRAGARARRRPGARRARAAPGDRAGWPRAPLHARRDGLPPEPGRPLAVDARRAGAALRGQRRVGVG